MKQPTEKQIKARKAFAIAIKKVASMKLKGQEKKDKLRELIKKHYQ
jgi:hypothetical protein